MELWPFIATANRACSLLYSYIKEHASGVWLLPVNVCPDVPLTFALAEVPFSFVDINPQTLCIDMQEVLRLINKEPGKYAGVIYVRTYGVLRETGHLFQSIKAIDDSILIIDDRCLCLPAISPEFWNADMILYSTGHCKQIDLNGGGLAYYSSETEYRIDDNLFYDGTDEEELYKKAFEKGVPFQRVPKGWLKMDSYDNPLEYLKRIDAIIPLRNKQRENINSIYSRNLPITTQMDPAFQQWRFNIRVPSHLKDTILCELFKNGLFASNHYHSVNRLFDNKKYAVSDQLFESVINLFNDGYYSLVKAQKTCDIINNVLNQN